MAGYFFDGPNPGGRPRLKGQTWGPGAWGWKSERLFWRASGRHSARVVPRVHLGFSAETAMATTASATALLRMRRVYSISARKGGLSASVSWLIFRSLGKLKSWQVVFHLGLLGEQPRLRLARQRDPPLLPHRPLPCLRTRLLTIINVIHSSTKNYQRRFKNA